MSIVDAVLSGSTVTIKYSITIALTKVELIPSHNWGNVQDTGVEFNLVEGVISDTNELPGCVGRSNS